MTEDCRMNGELRMNQKGDNNDNCLMSQRVDEARNIQIFVLVLRWEVFKTFEG